MDNLHPNRWRPANENALNFTQSPLPMMGLFKDRAPAPQPLGPLEVTVMEILWARGESNVRDVVDRLDRPLAYTTVMTTLDRLFKKGLLAPPQVRPRFHLRTLPES